MSFYWYDYETFGTHPSLDRPAQFAGIRTDKHLNIIGDPLCLYCLPADDFLPSPEACMITGITPDICLEKGIPECEFISKIHSELSKPGTCNVGYNNIRFDDEFTRHTLYRNFFDPYEHEWKNGNSRWDLLDIVRLTRALRPSKILWPTHNDGSINNTLASITLENGITHEHAHDALSDVMATISVARLLKERKPRLFEFAFSNRDKHSVSALLNLREQKVVVHVSGMIPGSYLHTAAIVPLIKHPSNSNGILVYDLRFDPTPFLQLSVVELAEKIFTSARDQNGPRLPVKTVHINRCPVIVPLSTLDEHARKRTSISAQKSSQHASIIKSNNAFAKKVQQAFAEHSFEPVSDPDKALYSGGFFTQSDKRAFDRIRSTNPAKLASSEFFYDDARIPQMLTRYKARNYPDLLDRQEKTDWEVYRKSRLNEVSDEGSGLHVYLSKLAELERDNPQHQELLKSLSKYAKNLFA